MATLGITLSDQQSVTIHPLPFRVCVCVCVCVCVQLCADVSVSDGEECEGREAEQTHVTVRAPVPLVLLTNMFPRMACLYIHCA